MNSLKSQSGHSVRMKFNKYEFGNVLLACLPILYICAAFHVETFVWVGTCIGSVCVA